LVAQVALAEAAHRLVKDSTSRALPPQVAEARWAECREAAEAGLAEVVEMAEVVPLGLATKA
jgi:hypothetical protein